MRLDDPTARIHAKKTYTSNGYTTLSSFQYHYIIIDKTLTDAVLKQPPNAPANAAPKGVSCWTGFDWVGIGYYKLDEEGATKLNISDDDGPERTLGDT